jgi:hypothetical protein
MLGLDAACDQVGEGSIRSEQCLQVWGYLAISIAQEGECST